MRYVCVTHQVAAVVDVLGLDGLHITGHTHHLQHSAGTGAGAAVGGVRCLVSHPQMPATMLVFCQVDMHICHMFDAPTVLPSMADTICRPKLHIHTQPSVHPSS